MASLSNIYPTSIYHSDTVPPLKQFEAKLPDTINKANTTTPDQPSIINKVMVNVEVNKLSSVDAINAGVMPA